MTTQTDPVYEDLLYGDVVKDWLGSFPGMDRHQCLEKIDVIWAEKGFLPPEELSSELLIGCLEPDPFYDQQAWQIRDMMKSAHPVDPMTGFADKPESAILTGLAHLYAQRTGEPVVMVDADYGNMGGTNLFYKQKMKEGGFGGRRYDDGFAETDMAARVSANIARSSLQNLVDQKDDPKAKLYAARPGGDELRLILFGVEQEQVDDWLTAKTHPEIENFTAEANLHDHPHTKDPENPFKTGFNLGLAAVGLNKSGVRPDSLLSFVDAKISAEKLLLGAERKGQVLNLDDYPTEDQGRELERAQRQAWQFRNLKQKNADPLTFIRTIDQHPKWSPMSVVDAPALELPIPLNLEKMMDRPFTDLFERMHHQLDINMQQDMPGTSEHNKSVLHAALERALPIDHSAGVYGPRYEEITARSVHHDSRRMGNDPAQMVHFEFGNLAGLNQMSHYHADVVLQHIGTIVREEICEAGVKGAEHNIFHQGGARFNSFLPNYRAIMDERGNYLGFKPLDEQDLKEMGTRINQRIDEEINWRPVADYFEERNVSLMRPGKNGQDEMITFGNGMPLIDSHGQKALFADMAHPKRAHETGINFLMTTQPMDDRPMAKQIKSIKETAELHINGRRMEARAENVALQMEMNDNQPAPDKPAASASMTRKM